MFKVLQLDIRNIDSYFDW